MDVHNAVIVVTGGGSGIGAAMAQAFAAEGARAVVLADRNLEGARHVAESIGSVGTAFQADVTDAAQVRSLIDTTIDRFGHLDLYCSNAGIATGKGLEAELSEWHNIWNVNVMATVHAAQVLLERTSVTRPIHLLITASAAGLLTNLGDAAYTATKHAAVGLAEWLAISHQDVGLTVSCLCPQGVRTPMVTQGLAQGDLAATVVESMGLIEPVHCAAAVIEGLRRGTFLILPHPEVAGYVRNKAQDPDRWIESMTRFQAKLAPRPRVVEAP